MRISIYNGKNEEISIVEGKKTLSLVHNKEYAEGDKIIISADEEKFLWIKLDQFVQEAFVYAPKGVVGYDIPFGKHRWAYHYCAFEGDSHTITVREVVPSNFEQRRNLAVNPIDQRNNESYYPHASANIVTNDAGFFEAKNAIDGQTITDGHGPYPWQSWGSDKADNAEFKLDFGRTVIIDEVVLYLRSDDFEAHDTYWESGILEFSDGTTQEIGMVKSPTAQRYAIEPRSVTWLKLHSLKRALPEAFAALTEIEVYGYEAKNRGNEV